MTENNIETGNGTSSRGFGSALVNVVTALFVVGALGVVVVLIVLSVTPDNFVSDLFSGNEPEPTPTLASVAVVPTLAPTDTPAPTATDIPSGVVPPTNTPLPRPDTPTPRPINTLQPTLTPSPSATLPPATPTKTPTPTPTDTATPGPSPTPTTTRSPFPFTKDAASPQYLQNYANNAGCDWMGIAGIVLDVNGNPVPYGEYRVHIWDSGIDERVVVGDAPAYGPSGYEQFLFNEPRFQENNVQLETINGTAVSQVYRIQTRTSCNENLIRFDFIQNH